MSYAFALIDLAFIAFVCWLASWLSDTPFTFAGVALCAAFVALVECYRVSRMLSDWRDAMDYLTGNWSDREDDQ